MLFVKVLIYLAPNYPQVTFLQYTALPVDEYALPIRKEVNALVTISEQQGESLGTCPEERKGATIFPYSLQIF